MSLYAGFDLGQKFGYAILDEDGNRVESETVNLGKRSGKSLSGFYDLLQTILSNGVIAAGYEKVRRHRGVHAAHAYGGYEAILKKLCFDMGIEDKLLEVTVQQIKRCATDDPKADKEEIEAQAMARWARIPEDDNEADALFCAEVVRRMLNGITV